MKFRTIVDIPRAPFSIQPCEEMLFVGSCFAENIGSRFVADRFKATVNPYGVMYNPASILHTVQRYLRGEGMETVAMPKTVVMTLGTSHVYVLRETGEIVDNCRKRPQRLFEERDLTIAECADCLSEAVRLLLARRNDVRVIMTVSPIRYAKYGFHESALAKSTLLLAIDSVMKSMAGTVHYFPAYEIVLDELRDYRFYREDMLHPSEQAVTYIWERFSETFFGEDTMRFLSEWQPIKAALAHRPFDAESQEYKDFMQKTMDRYEALRQKYPELGDLGQASCATGA